MTDPVDSDLPWAVQRWSVVVDAKDLNYGDVHGMIHRDIALGNSYRAERIKLLLTLATGMFGFTVTFHKDLLGGPLAPGEFWLVIVGWAALLLSMLAGIVHLQKWEDYYLEFSRIGAAIWRHRVAPNPAERTEAKADYTAAKAKMKGFQDGYKCWNTVQTWALLAGMALLALQIVVSGSHLSAAGAANPPATTTTPPAVTTPPAGATTKPAGG